ncbi:hypothetical protein R5N98_12585 [Tenacibaculum maritimum]|uniref:hypothetical protein n=1 Tax=Tenacibaculum maritimum TaxID=107401 RepID=UPI00388E4B70
MKKFFILALLALFISCSSNTAKYNLIDDFAIFILNTEDEIKKAKNIKWETKLDSLNSFISQQESFDFTPTEQKSFEEKVKWLKKSSNSNSTVSNSGSYNFYFENSASINGYLKQKEFQQTVNRIYSNLDDKNVSSFFVNTKEHPEKNILDRINKADIKVGNITDSDHTFIFQNAIENASDGAVSIVITDGIYSVKGGNLNLVSIQIESAFKKALKVSEIESVIIKMSSNFDGNYYSSTCADGRNKQKINQERPYYVMLFGNTAMINESLKNVIVTDDLSGYKEKARFSLTKNLETPFTILTFGEEKHGEFEAINRGTSITQSIKNAKKFERNGFGGTPKEENYLQFAIAVDFTETNLPNSYLTNISNYKLNEELGYEINDILPYEDISKSSDTYRKLAKLGKSNSSNFSHIIVLKAETKLYGELGITLNNNLPDWIKNTGNKDDCEIKEDTQRTFAFDELMIGISKAYNKVNNKEEILKININIKA